MQKEVVKTHTHTHPFPSHYAFTSAPDGLTHTPFGAFKGLCFFSVDDIQKYWMFFGSNLFLCAPPEGATWVIKSQAVWRGACRRRGRTPVPTSSSATRLLHLWLRGASRNWGRKRWRRAGRKGEQWLRCEKTTVSESHEYQIWSQVDRKTKAHAANKSPESFAGVSQARMDIKWSPVNQTVVC